MELLWTETRRWLHLLFTLQQRVPPPTASRFFSLLKIPVINFFQLEALLDVVK